MYNLLKKLSLVLVLTIGTFLLSSFCSIAEPCECQIENCRNIALADYQQEVGNCWWWQFGCIDDALDGYSASLASCLNQYEICLLIALGTT